MCPYRIAGRWVDGNQPMQVVRHDHEYINRDLGANFAGTSLGQVDDQPEAVEAHRSIPDLAEQTCALYRR